MSVPAAIMNAMGEHRARIRVDTRFAEYWVCTCRGWTRKNPTAYTEAEHEKALAAFQQHVERMAARP